MYPVSTGTLSGVSKILELFQTVLRSDVGAWESFSGTRPDEVKAAGQSKPLPLLEEKGHIVLDAELLNITTIYKRRNALPV